MNRQSRVWVPLALLLLCAAPAFAQKARWIETYSWQGKGSQQTPVFFVTGDKWRLAYRPKGKGPFQVVLSDESGREPKTLTDQKGYPLASGRRSLTGTGRRFLAITAPGVEWQIVVEQLMTPIQEWHLVQLAKKEVPELALLATYVGETGEDEFELRVPRGSWRLFSHVEGTGALTVAISLATDDGEVLTLSDLPTGDGGSWVHRSGTFRVRTTAGKDCRWKLDVCSVK